MEFHLTNLVPDQIIKALCSTLIHSLWQGLILAVVTGLAVVLTKKSSAALRYNLMISFLLLFAAGVVVTFMVQLRPTENHIPTTAALVAPAQQLQVINNQADTAANPGNVIATSIGYFNAHADAIVLIWFLIICARCVQFAAGLQNIYYLRRNKVIAAGAYWDNKINRLANNMGIKGTVAIMQSGIAKIPMVLGHFKPVVLIPIGLLTALSAEEVESILIHELAHIRRKDFMVNLLQNLMEIVFFFNPAVLWVSALIKSERENCCDDMVVAQTSSKVSYIKALVSCEEYHSAMPAYAMGLGGKNGHFLNRVKRMLSNNNQSLNRVEKAVLTICLVSAVVITAAFSKPAKEKTSTRIKRGNVPAIAKTFKNDSLSQSLMGYKDTTAAAVLRIRQPDEVSEGTFLKFDGSVNNKKYLVYLAKKDGVLYQYNSTYDTKVINYYVDGKPVPAGKIAQYQSRFNEIINQDVQEPASPPAPEESVQNNGEKGEIVDAADEKAKARADMAGDNSAKLMRDSMKRAYWLGSLEAMHSKLNGPLGSKDSTWKKTGTYVKSMTDSKKESYVRAMVDSNKRHFRSVWAKPAVPAKPATPATPASPASSALPALPASPAAPAKGPGNPPVPPVGAAYTPYKPNYKPYEPREPVPPVAPLPNMGDEITKDLLKSDLIKDKANYTFKITDDALYVDGIKQPDAVYKEIVGKYVKPGDKINYTRTNTTKN